MPKSLTKMESWAKWCSYNGFKKLSIALVATSCQWSLLECGKQLCLYTNRRGNKVQQQQSFYISWADEELHDLQWSWLQIFTCLKQNLLALWVRGRVGKGWKRRWEKRNCYMFHVGTVLASIMQVAGVACCPATTLLSTKGYKQGLCWLCDSASRLEWADPQNTLKPHCQLSE